MSSDGAEMFAAAFRSVGVDARVCPIGNGRALELGERHTAGDECLPARLTLGSFLTVTEEPGFAAESTAFFMPTADGPCRFGQYAPYFRKVLSDLGLGAVELVSPSSRDGYAGLGTEGSDLVRTALRGLICADILRKMLYRTRPYELTKGDGDTAHAEQVRVVADVLGRRRLSSEHRMRMLEAVMVGARDEFRRIPVRNLQRRPSIGIVGEIFCRLTPFTNEQVVRRIEALGGECKLAHLIEWVWYTNTESQSRLVRQGRRFSRAMLSAKVLDWIQRRDERRLYAIVARDLQDDPEPSIEEILRHAEPYLPASGALGEMALSVGRAVFLHHHGCHGVIDISPFTCMNGIVTEAIYPRVSADLGGMPIRNLYFDGTSRTVDRDVEILLELARSYQSRKLTHPSRLGS